MEALKKTESPLSVQIIPNVNRIKSEKKLAQRLVDASRDTSVPYEPIPLSHRERADLERHDSFSYYL